VALDLLLFGWPLVPSVDRVLYDETTQSARFLHDEPEPVRVYWPADPRHQDRAFDAENRVKFTFLTFCDFGPWDVATWRQMREAMIPNVAMLDGVASANNFEPLMVGRTVDLLDAVATSPALLRVMGVTHVVSDEAWPGGERVHASTAAATYRLPRAPGRVWLVPAAREVDPGAALSVLVDPAFDPAAEVLLEDTLAPGVPLQTPGGQIPSFASHPPILRDTANRVTIRAVLTVPGYLVVADTWYPGWQASVDEEPVELYRANHAFRAVWLDKGEHTVDMVYRPASVYIGGIVSLAALGTAIACLALTRREDAAT